MLCLFCSHVIILWDLVDFLEKMHPTVTFSVFGNYIFGCHGWPQCSDVGTSGGILICSSEIKHELRSSRLETFSNCPGCSSRFWVLEIRYFFPAPEQFLCSPSKSNPHPLQKKKQLAITISISASSSVSGHQKWIFTLSWCAAHICFESQLQPGALLCCWGTACYRLNHHLQTRYDLAPSALVVQLLPSYTATKGL